MIYRILRWLGLWPDADSEKKLDAAIEAAQAKVDELKKEYKDWQDDVDKVTKPDSKSEDDDKDEDIEDDNTEVEKSNEPIDAEDVEAAKADLSTPLSQEAVRRSQILLFRPDGLWNRRTYGSV